MRWVRTAALVSVVATCLWSRDGSGGGWLRRNWNKWVKKREPAGASISGKNSAITIKNLVTGEVFSYTPENIRENARRVSKHQMTLASDTAAKSQTQELFEDRMLEMIRRANVDILHRPLSREQGVAVIHLLRKTRVWELEMKLRDLMVTQLKAAEKLASTFQRRNVQEHEKAEVDRSATLYLKGYEDLANAEEQFLVELAEVLGFPRSAVDLDGDRAEWD